MTVAVRHSIVLDKNWSTHVACHRAHSLLHRAWRGRHAVPTAADSATSDTVGGSAERGRGGGEGSFLACLTQRARQSCTTGAMVERHLSCSPPCAATGAARGGARGSLARAHSACSSRLVRGRRVQPVYSLHEHVPHRWEDQCSRRSTILAMERERSRGEATDVVRLRAPPPRHGGLPAPDRRRFTPRIDAGTLSPTPASSSCIAD